MSDSGVPRVAQDGDSVTAHYIGRLDNGEVFDSSYELNDPLAFTVGEEQMISGFEEAVRGLRVGESRTIRLEPWQAYGERDERLVLRVPVERTPEGLKPGDRVQLRDRAAIVIEASAAQVTVDANHPLAGQALTFEIALVTIG